MKDAIERGIDKDPGRNVWRVVVRGELNSKVTRYVWWVGSADELESVTTRIDNAENYRIESVFAYEFVSGLTSPNSYSDVKTWDNAMDRLDNAANSPEKVIPDFATIEAATEWIFSRAHENADNFRFAWTDDAEQVMKYAELADAGCCGSADEDITIQGRLAMIGCNFGH
jgi:hypothetical protein